MTRHEEHPILTLEPLIQAVQEGVEDAGWALSGLQKTTSHDFEGRWAGDSSRSAYLFFHLDDAPDFVSIDVFLDETTRGVSGNLALVVDLLPLGRIGDAREALRGLGTLSTARLPGRYRTPLTLRLRLPAGGGDPDTAEVEVRFKVRLEGGTIDAGRSAVRTVAAEAVRAFESILSAAELQRFVAD